MLNFTIGPVQSPECVHVIGAQDIPYFRTPEFSQIMLENERLLLKFTHAPEGARAVFLTGSGTAGMESAVMNVLTPSDRALVINGGSFGQRFADLCGLHDIPHEKVVLSPGHGLRAADLAPFEASGYTALLVNMHETSTGVLYDMPLIADFCRRNDMLLVVDAISSFLADPFDMASLGADVTIIGSQKALACPPGVSALVLSPRALGRIKGNQTKCLYLDLKGALDNQTRGQTPFTPAVGTLLQINARLREMDASGGDSVEIARTQLLAEDFRSKIRDLPFEPFSDSPSHAVTALHPLSVSAYDLFLKLKDDYGIWICPNGGHLKDTVFRVGHLGRLTPQDNDTLVAAFRDLHQKGFL